VAGSRANHEGTERKKAANASEKPWKNHRELQVVKLPWKQDCLPLMLAPMQGLTNRALRNLFINRVRPDVVFTEYVRAQADIQKCISDSDRQEIENECDTTPLVVQLIGSNIDFLVAAAVTVQELGAKHLNINLGCPYGRMTTNTAGGALLRAPADLPLMLKSLRKTIRGSFSVKVRSGYDDPSQLLSLVTMFEDCGIDFLIVHPRTVQQRFKGLADHNVTADVVRKTSLPVIANGDIWTVADGERVLSQTGAAGLMLGRGAIADPLLFERLRGNYSTLSTPEQRAHELRDYLQELFTSYQKLFCGDQQVLWKMKEVLSFINDPCFSKQFRKLKKTRGLTKFSELLENLGSEN
jgi:tRNA-dihydrouridine synthase B